MIAMTLADFAGRAHHAWGGPPFPFLLFPLLWLLFAVAVVTAFLLTRRHREATAGRRSGEQVLAERFAAGEIDTDEYQARRAVLRQKKE